MQPSTRLLPIAPTRSLSSNRDSPPNRSKGWLIFVSFFRSLWISLRIFVLPMKTTDLWIMSSICGKKSWCFCQTLNFVFGHVWSQTFTKILDVISKTFYPHFRSCMPLFWLSSFIRLQNLFLQTNAPWTKRNWWVRQCNGLCCSSICTRSIRTRKWTAKMPTTCCTLFWLWLVFEIVVL